MCPMDRYIWFVVGGIALFSTIRKMFRLELTPEQKKTLREISNRSILSDKEFIQFMNEKPKNDNIVKKVRHVVAEEVIAREGRIDGCLLYPEDRLWEDLAIGAVDGLDYTAIIIQLERALSISIPGEEAASIKTVEDLIHLCERCQSKRF
jgi:acyl carrier protein